LHPSLTLFLWLCAVLLVQRLQAAPLGALVLISAGLSGAVVRQHWRRLLVRTRWLLLVLAVTFLWLTPGERLYPGIPLTWEGLLSAGEHLLRLLAVLFAVAWLLGRQSLLQIVSGLYGIARAFGAGAERAVVRLALVLQYVERGDAADWRRLLQEHDASGESTLMIHYRSARPRDWWLGFGGLAVTLAVWWLA
jgi:hypothetical protein